MKNIPIAILEIERELSRDDELRGAVDGCLGLVARAKGSSLPWREVVECLSQITGEFDLRPRAVHLVHKLIELGLLRKYRMVDNQLEFTELAESFSERSRIRKPALLAGPQPEPARKLTPVSGEKRGRWPGTVIGPEGLSERLEDALLDLDALADSDGLLPSGLALRLYRLWQERGSKFLTKDPNGLYSGSVHPLIVKGLLDRKLGQTRLSITEQGRALARQIRHRRLRDEYPVS